MGEQARRALLRRTSGGERIDLCVRKSDEYIARYLERIPIPEDADEEERARIQFWALRMFRE